MRLPRVLTALTFTASLLGAGTGGGFSAVTYNIAGLPSFISSSSPQLNTAHIGRLLSAYDIVHVQEDFNYHAILYAHNDHPHRTPTSGRVLVGDGLNTLSRFPLVDFKRVTWTERHGADVLTPKGFSYHRVRLAEGAYADFYNLHANAGVSAKDLAARRANIAQLSAFITAHSAGSAVVVMGDTNCRYTRAGDQIRLLGTANGLTDTWIELIRQGDEPAAGSPPIVVRTAPKNTDEVVDKIFYRSSRLLTLQPTRYRLNDAAFYHPVTRQPLSDHWPVFTDFAWRLSQDYRASDLFGTALGLPFHDIDHITADTTVHSLTLHAGPRINQVGITLNDDTVLSHGYNGGNAVTLVLQPDEHFTAANLDAVEHEGQPLLSYAEFTTNQGRTLSAGTRTRHRTGFTAPSGWKISGFYGNKATHLHQLGLLYTRIEK